jgi:hypothetical protein
MPNSWRADPDRREHFYPAHNLTAPGAGVRSLLWNSFRLLIGGQPCAAGTQQLPDPVELVAIAGTEETVIAHLYKAFG